MKTAIITLALPLAGKTTWIEKNLPNKLVVSADVWKQTRPGYDPNHAYLLHEESVAWAERTVYTLAGEGEDFVLDSGSINGSYTERIIRKLKSLGYAIQLVWIKTPLLVCLDRNEVRERKVPRDNILMKAQKEKAQFYKLKALVDETKIVPYFTNKNLFVDMDGVLAAYSTLPRIDGKIDFVNSQVFKYLEPVKPVIDKLKLYAATGCKLRILSATPNSFAYDQKNDWLDEHFNIVQSDRYFVNSGRHKAEMLNDLVQHLKLDKRDVTMLDDTHEILYDVKELRMRPLHVSSFLTEDFTYYTN